MATGKNIKKRAEENKKHNYDLREDNNMPDELTALKSYASWAKFSHAGYYAYCVVSILGCFAFEMVSSDFSRSALCVLYVILSIILLKFRHGNKNEISRVSDKNDNILSKTVPLTITEQPSDGLKVRQKQFIPEPLPDFNSNSMKIISAFNTFEKDNAHYHSDICIQIDKINSILNDIKVITEKLLIENNFKFQEIEIDVSVINKVLGEEGFFDSLTSEIEKLNSKISLLSGEIRTENVFDSIHNEVSNIKNNVFLFEKLYDIILADKEKILDKIDSPGYAVALKLLSDKTAKIENSLAALHGYFSNGNLLIRNIPAPVNQEEELITELTENTEAAISIFKNNTLEYLTLKNNCHEKVLIEFASMFDDLDKVFNIHSDTSKTLASFFNDKGLYKDIIISIGKTVHINETNCMEFKNKSDFNNYGKYLIKKSCFLLNGKIYKKAILEKIEN